MHDPYVVVNSALRDRSLHPHAASFSVELDPAIDLQQYASVELAGSRVPTPYVLTLREGENLFRFSEDVLLYDRVSEKQSSYTTVHTVTIPARFYTSILEVASTLEAAVNAVSTAKIEFVYDCNTDRFTLVSGMQRKPEAPPDRPALCAFHVFASPLLEMLGFYGYRDHLMVGGIPYFTKKASLEVQGELPSTVRVADRIVMACRLPSGAVHTEIATVTSANPTSFCIDHRPAFSDHLVTVHHGILYSATAPRRIPAARPDRIMFLNLPGLVTPTRIYGSPVPAFAVINLNPLGQSFCAPLATETRRGPQGGVLFHVLLSEEDGRPADFGKEELCLLLRLRLRHGHPQSAASASCSAE